MCPSEGFYYDHDDFAHTVAADRVIHFLKLHFKEFVAYLDGDRSAAKEILEELREWKEES
jgi:hypothetical protein